MSEKKLPEQVVLPNYDESIMNLACSIQQYYGITPKHKTLPAVDSILFEQHPKHVVVIVLDGLGMNILEKNLHVRDYLRKHLLAEYSSVFPPTTTASTTSALTGLSPIEHGWLGWDVYFGQEDKTVTCFTNTIQDSKEPAANYHVAKKWLPYKDIVDQINETGKAKAFRIFPFGPEAHPELSDWSYAIEDTCKGFNPTFTYAYWENPDSLLHSEGTNSNDVTKIVEELNAQMAYLTSRCKETAFFITADHGHFDIRRDFISEEYPDIAKMLLRKPCIEPRAMSLFVKPEYVDSFAREFNGHFLNDYVLFTKEEVLKNELFGPGFPNENSTTIGDFVAAAYTHKALFWDKNAKPFKSHHAGLTKEEMRIPLISVVNRPKKTGMIVWYAVSALLLFFLYMIII